MKIETNSLVGVDLTGKIVVLKDGVLKPCYDTFDNYFYRATGGFGCFPGTIGKAVFTDSLAEPELKERWSRGDFAGWLTDDQYAELKAKQNS